MSDSRDVSLVHSLPDAETEWWYYHGHLKTQQGELGFHVAFFRRNTKEISIGRVIRGSWFCQDAWFAHFSIADVSGGEFHYAQRRSEGGVSNESCRVWIQDWSVCDVDGAHQLRVQSRDHGLELKLSPVKSLTAHHELREHRKTEGDKTDYRSVTRLAVEGMVTLNGRRLNVEGLGWMDRESGPFKLNRDLQGWDWFAIQTSSGRELMIYRMKDAEGATTESSRACIHHPDGAMETLNLDSWEFVALRHWVSPDTGIEYPVEWQIRERSLGVDLRVKARVDCAELDARGSSCMIYWEGPAAAVGDLSGERVDAQAYVELVGYNDQISVGTYDYASNNLPLTDWLYASARYLLRNNGVTRTMDGPVS